jgi:hypothetical protein
MPNVNVKSFNCFGFSGRTGSADDSESSYTRHIDVEEHQPGKRNIQKIERKHMTLRTRIKRLTRKTIYDYLGFLSLRWPNGVDQIPVIVGTIVWTASHSGGQAKAGLVASWHAVRQA